MRENRSAYQRVWFRPRILRDVEKIDFSTMILGQKVRRLQSPLQTLLTLSDLADVDAYVALLLAFI